MPATAEPPAAPAPPPAAPTAPAAPALPPPVDQTTHVRPGSAKARVFADLAKKAKTPEQAMTTAEPRTETPSAPPAPATEPKTEPASTPEPPEPGEDAPTEPATAPAAPAAKKGEKVNPWKLVDEYKAKVGTLEKQIAEAKTSALAEQERNTYVEKVGKLEARTKELEDHIRYVDYTKSEEFQTKYQQPYEKAWERAATELREIGVNDPATGEQRPATADDLAQLVNLPLGKARELANQLFGDFADDVMAHRKEIRSLFESQNSALEDAKKNGSARIKEQQDKMKLAATETQKAVAEAWKAENDAATGDPKFGKYFVPKEGDQEWNQRLGKGFEMVDRAFSENPMDPRLKPEDRKAIIKRHAAVRNRAAGWGPLRHLNEQLEARVAELTKELEQYKSTEPPTTGGSRPEAPTPEGGSAWGAVRAGLQKIAK